MLLAFVPAVREECGADAATVAGTAEVDVAAVVAAVLLAAAVGSRRVEAMGSAALAATAGLLVCAAGRPWGAAAAVALWLSPAVAAFDAAALRCGFLSDLATSALAAFFLPLEPDFSPLEAAPFAS